MLGLLASRGVGVPQDRERARALFQRACEEGERDACSELAALTREGGE
jgi:TPR repeat protein